MNAMLRRVKSGEKMTPALALALKFARGDPLVFLKLCSAISTSTQKFFGRWCRPTMSRAVPYVAKPTEALLQRFSEAADARIYVVQEPGPTSFVLKSADSERKHRVSIGSVHSCSCGAREQPCVHTSFVLLRIFRLPAGDQRAWQGGLLDSELERIIEERARTTAARRQQQRMAAAPVATASGGGGGAPRPGEVAQREIDDANKEPCPICYEDISCEDQQAGKLEWCRLGCLTLTLTLTLALTLTLSLILA